MSPKKQPTASKKARRAAREGAKFTTALRAADRDADRTPPLPSYVAVLDEQTLSRSGP
ncbi:hypothetical protein ACIRU3_39045 [Streptomyces sp. NPDC101151]|uniref:hypothetical protein n=1 Tax=Streptomyces sp. NPDC101151 TaxID=3366115 RepID=UPI0037FEC589